MENELYKFGRSTSLTVILAKLLELYINLGRQLENINIGLLCPILKLTTESPFDKDITRPITVSETMASLFEKYMLHNIIKYENVHQNQFGFKTNSSTNHAIYMLREMMRESKLNNKGMYLFV